MNWLKKRGVPASKPMMEGPHLCSVRSAVSCLRAFIPGDRRYIELITDALSWAMTHFDELGYNCKTGKQKLQIMPNMVGFQFVLRGICSRLGAPNRKADIVVDQQSQFNTTQRELREFYYQIREMPWVHGPGLPVMDVTNMPAERWFSSRVQKVQGWSWLIYISGSSNALWKGRS